MSYTEFQVMSDLHLETPKTRPCYETFKIKPQSWYLALLGDIGYISDERLFKFLAQQLQQFDIVFFLLGNHEAYNITFPGAKTRMKAFEKRMTALHQKSTLGKFILLDQTRYDISNTLTVLGCTLFSQVVQEQERNVSMFVTDFHAINDWTHEDHNAAHHSDLTWLNNTVTKIEKEEPRREIIIFTHHSPTVLEAANDPAHRESEVSSAFVTDLSQEICWTSPLVKLWAWGHTHFNCDFKDPVTGKRCVANQKGYGVGEKFDFDRSKLVSISGAIQPRKLEPKKTQSSIAILPAAQETSKQSKLKVGGKDRRGKCVLM